MYAHCCIFFIFIINIYKGTTDRLNANTHAGFGSGTYSFIGATRSH